MIQSQETIILFIAILLASALVVSTLYSQISSSTGRASSISSEVQSKTLSSYEIVQVYENNVYVRGVSGKLDVNNVVVTLNGAPQSVSVTFLRDNGDPNILEPNDLVVITLPVAIKTSDCLFIDIDGVSSSWGVCG